MSGDKDLDSLVDMMASAGPSGGGPKKEVTYADFQKMLDETPLFMRDTPEDGSENPVLEGLRSLMLEGQGDEGALNFKNHGNEHHQLKQYKEAVKSYTEGLDAGPEDHDLRISLLNNRAACNLALRNHGQVLKDVGVIFVLSTKEGKAVPVKALYRAAKSLVALERWKEASDVVSRGKELAGAGAQRDWDVLAGEIERGVRRGMERAERIRRETLGKEALRIAVQSRGLMVVNTPSPPDNPHPLAFDPASLPADPPLYTPPSASSSAGSPSVWTPPPPHTPIIFPTFLLYPTHAQSDLITHFHEDTSLQDQIATMFPSDQDPSSPAWAPWDTKHEYYGPNLVVYVETKAKRLLKVGKELTLREVVRKACREPKDGVPRDGMILKDGLLSFVVLPKGSAEKGWIDDFKRQRDGK